MGECIEPALTRRLSFLPAAQADLDELINIRVEAMRESLERIGRFDPARARERFASGFDPVCTQFMVVNGVRAGFVVVKPQNRELLLDHLYVRTCFQGQGIGSAVLQMVFVQADAQGLPVRKGALRQSASNCFYLRHGFIQVDECEWDVYYVRPPHST